MEHLAERGHFTLKATTEVATEQGEFTAVISTASIDRKKDIVDPDGMVAALHEWVAVGKKIPLAWNHSTAAQDQIGHIDPASAKNVNGEVVVEGWIDRSIEVGKHAWRLVKAGTLGFSFGYLVPEGGATKRAGGGRHLKQFDVFEVTASNTPMNNDTRVLAWKSAAARTAPTEAQLRKRTAALGLEPPLSRKELRRRCDDVALDAALGWEPPPKIDPEPDPEPVPTDRDQRRRFDQLRIELLLGDAAPPPIKARLPPDYDAIKAQARDDMLALLRGADEQAGDR